MSERSFGALFSPYLSTEQLSESLASGEVENMEMEHATRRIECVVRFSAPVSVEELARVEQLLSVALRLNAVSIVPVFSADLFSVDVLQDLIVMLNQNS